MTTRRKPHDSPVCDCAACEAWERKTRITVTAGPLPPGDVPGRTHSAVYVNDDDELAVVTFGGGQVSWTDAVAETLWIGTACDESADGPPAGELATMIDLSWRESLVVSAAREHAYRKAAAELGEAFRDKLGSFGWTLDDWGWVDE